MQVIKIKMVTGHIVNLTAEGNWDEKLDLSRLSQLQRLGLVLNADIEKTLSKSITSAQESLYM